MNQRHIAVKSSAIGVCSQIISLICKFVVRTFQIRFLGVELLGLDGVLIDYIAVLSLADLGLTSAMIYHLYKPVIENDEDKINELMAVYRQIYQIIALMICGIGMILLIFLPKIVKDVEFSNSYLVLAYIFQLVATVSSYLLAYKRIYLNAKQKQYVCIIIDTITLVLFSILKIAVLICFKSYMAFLVMSIIQNIFSNTVINIYCGKYYSFLKQRKAIDITVRKKIFSEVKDVFGSKIAGYVYSSTDNIVISIILGTVQVGIASNYKYLMSAIKGLVNSAMSTIQPIIGNFLNADHSNGEMYRLLKNYSFVRYILAVFTAVPFLCVVDKFVEMWAGKEYLMSSTIPILLVIDYFIGSMSGPLGEFLTAEGMFKYEKNVSILAAIFNVCGSLLGAKLLGVQGVLIATVISQCILWIGRGKAVFECVLKKNMIIDFVKISIKYVICFVIMGVLGLVIAKRIHIFGLIGCIVSGMVSLVVVSVIVFLFYYQTEEFKYVVTLIDDFFIKKFIKNLN